MSQAGSFQFNRMDCKDESTSLESYDDSNYNNSNSSSISGNSSPSNDSKEKEKARVTQTSLVLWHARQNDSKALKKLLDQDPSLVQARDYDERTALHVAALHGCVEAAKCLLEHGASINAQDRWQNSPLADAEGANQQDMVELLKMNGGKHLVGDFGLSKLINVKHAHDMYKLTGETGSWERIVSSLARMVTIIWLLVVLILTSSCTASLTSILTVQQMKPTIEDVSYLRAAGFAAGYQDGSFVEHYIQEMFAEDFAGALSNGSVAAIFDEIPYIREFLSTQCGYTMVGPNYRTGGLGFVFPEGSPLILDISRDILSLLEDKEMKVIQSKWFNNTTCTNPEAKVVSNRLSMESLWGLYLITRTTSIVALILFFSCLLYNFIRGPNVVKETKGDPSTEKSLKSFAKYMDRRERKRSRSNSPCSTLIFIPSPPNHRNTIPFNTTTSSLSISN